MAELARLGRVSRARITQIMDLLMLAPDIQEVVLLQTVRALVVRSAHRVALNVAWSEQRSQ